MIEAKHGLVHHGVYTRVSSQLMTLHLTRIHTTVDKSMHSSYKPLSSSDSPVNQYNRHIHTTQTQGNTHTPWASRGRLCENSSSAMSESDDVALFLSFVVALLTRLPTHRALTHARTRSGFDGVVSWYRLACDGVLLVARRRV